MYAFVAHQTNIMTIISVEHAFPTWKIPLLSDWWYFLYIYGWLFFHEGFHEIEKKAKMDLNYI